MKGERPYQSVLMTVLERDVGVCRRLFKKGDTEYSPCHVHLPMSTDNPWQDLDRDRAPARPVSVPADLDAHNAWADAQGNPPPPARPASPPPAFPSLAAIARSLSIPSVVRPRPRPLSMDSAEPIPSPSSNTRDVPAPQHPSPLSKPPSDPSPSASATPPTTTPRRDRDPQFDFQSFLDQMKSRGADPVAKYLRSQVIRPRPECR